MKTAYRHALTASFLSLLVACGGGGGGGGADTPSSGSGTTISSDPAANVVTTFASGFSRPKGVAVDSNGNVYVSDSVNNTIKKITAAGVVTTLAGTEGVSGYADGTGAAARFDIPKGIAVDSNGTVYVSDSYNHTIRKITSTGVVTTLAGVSPAQVIGGRGYADGIGSAARFNEPAGLDVDSNGNVYVADYRNFKIRKITAAGVVSTLAGGARFAYPEGVSVDSNGNLYVAENDSTPRIRKITAAGVVSSFDLIEPGKFAGFTYPTGVVADSSGNVYVSDLSNRIYKISPSGVVNKVAGNTLPPTGGTDGTGDVAKFNSPSDVAIDLAGNLYVADELNNKIRKITLAR